MARFVTDPNAQTSLSLDMTPVQRAVQKAQSPDPKIRAKWDEGLTPEQRSLALGMINSAQAEFNAIEAEKQAEALEADAPPIPPFPGTTGAVRTSSTATPTSGQSLTGDQVGAAALWAYQMGVATTAGKPAVPDPRVLRPGPSGIKTKQYTGPRSANPRGVRLQPGSTLDAYKGEFGAKIEDSEFREWLKRRATVLAGADPTKPSSLLSSGLGLWNSAGEFVAANPQLRLSKTPEEWIDYQYQMAGGDAAYEAAVAENNPITHNRQVNTYTVNAAYAQAAINDMSEALLGRMASDAELKRARKSIQKLLTPTVTDTTTDATDPNNTMTTQHTKAGVGPDDAAKLLEMRMKRGSEGMAMNVGQMFEAAMARM